MKALVTGGRRGIGRAIAHALGGAGLNGAGKDVEDSAGLGATVAEVSALGVKAVAVIGDISDLDAHKAMLDAAEAERAGLVSRVVPAARLIDEAMEAASTIAGMSAPIAMMVKVES